MNKKSTTSYCTGCEGYEATRIANMQNASNGSTWHRLQMRNSRINAIMSDFRVGKKKNYMCGIRLTIV